MNSVVFVVGPPGGGKTTLAMTLAKHIPEACHFAAGRCWQRFATKPGALGRLVAETLESEKPIEDALFLRVHRLFFKRNRRQKVFVIDGNPFGPWQVELIMAAYEQAIGQDVYRAALVLEGTPAECQTRMAERQRCGEDTSRIEQRIRSYFDGQLEVMEHMVLGNCFDGTLRVKIDTGAVPIHEWLSRMAR